ncbi:hypothetical protein SAMN02910289_00413 [Lachnospiraceae bacterium RM5]|nr:hypothetical protein SAMN02910289_00413 [Lachnospiraceae bacterium RM5]
MSENVVLCGSNSYEKKYYLNPAFEMLPQDIQDELKIMCVLYTEDIGGILTLEYKDDGSLEFKVMSVENDPFFDEIGSELKISRLRKEKKELLEKLELFYRVVILKEE